MPVIALRQVQPVRPAPTAVSAAAVRPPAALAEPDRFRSQIAADPAIGLPGLAAARKLQEGSDRALLECLAADPSLDVDRLYGLAARHWDCPQVDLGRLPADPRLLSLADPVRCLAQGWLPWRQIGGQTVIVAATPDRFARQKVQLQASFGPVRMALAPMSQIESALIASCGPRLAQRAETLVPASESCRGLDAARLRRPAILALALLGLLFLLAPKVLVLALIGLALAAMAASALLRMAVLIVAAPPAPDHPPPAEADLPLISIMVALYHESDIATRLTARLGQLDYPPDRVEVLLVVEAADSQTRQALATAILPGWMRVVVVPPGKVTTKPRALNYALDHCRGSIVGVYDAEDAPEPDQLRKVAAQFAAAAPDVACLQGRLDYYNPHTNWLSRCFTLEYAAWFRLFLPGIAALGLAVPLGGTTLFFRRDVLIQLGGWDAQNVTEDADLGLRLTRHGHRTELLASTTFEEANCRARPWVKQRSRWIKGYMMTWLCHMRAPGLLLRQLGLRRFLGFQVMFLGAILQVLLAPVLWSLWPMSLGLWHPLAGLLSPFALLITCAAMLGVQALVMACDLIGLRRSRQPINPVWIVTLSIYHMLATLAAYKALWELCTRPFYWDKTQHGGFGG